MNERPSDVQMREIALEQAVNGSLNTDSPEAVVGRAEAFYAFLKGSK